MSESWSPVSFERTQGTAPIVLVCEHASRVMPAEFGDLGLDRAARSSHAAWDIGGADVARHLSATLDAPLALCGVSRLLFDCNRPPTAQDAIPAKSELIDVPGNAHLTTTQRMARVRLIHDPFHAAVANLIATHRDRIDGPVAVVTIHSFTPIYFGKIRDVEIGFLHHAKPEISLKAQKLEDRNGRFRTAINEPYGVSDGVTYSLEKHADANQLHSTMVEIRNDLIDTKAKAHIMADHLAETLKQAVASVIQPMEPVR